MKRRYNRKFLNPITIITLFIASLVVMLTVGFSLLSETLSFGDLGVNVDIQSDIRITNISLFNTANSGVSNWESYNLRSISSGISLPNEDSSVTFSVEITNIGNLDMGLSEIRGLQSNLEYSISNYTMKDRLCDDTDNTRCSLGSVSTLNITIGYKDNGYDETNTDYAVTLLYIFKQIHNIEYVNITNNNYPETVLHGEDIQINLDNPIPSIITIVGSNTYTYNNNTGTINIRNVTNDLTITAERDTYFKEYDGGEVYDNNGTAYYKLFGEFDNTKITSFERNTSLTLEQVLQKVNNGTAKIISTDDDDQYYPSVKPIYGWVSSNKFYWWSESDTVYFHPNTKGAFRNMAAVTTINLTGTNTSRVKNFSHWFDKDKVLTTITGKINTNGLVLEYNENFNYGNDTDENQSSGKGLAFMFNDCNALRAIDLSEFNTTNASDMKRMFGGCNNIKSLDLSHFDTKNVKSMYWMFRKNYYITELDLSHFDTSKVENMLGMFVSAQRLVSIKFGSHFDTKNVKRTTYMFYGDSKLTTIFARIDFDNSSIVDDSYMFNGASVLIGASGTNYATPYSSSHTGISYAKIASSSQQGYFTLDSNLAPYYITYQLNGGTANNPSMFYENTETFTLVNPVKEGYTFIGWTGSNGDEPQMTVTIPIGTTENLHYEANYEIIPIDMFPTVFRISGSCNFNGSATNITGNTCVNDLDNTDYTNDKYIDTNIQLYNSDNYTKDFEIYFEISNYSPNNQETLAGGNKQHTIMNTKSESVSGYPGIVFRRASNDLEIKSFTKSSYKAYNEVTSITIARINRKIYYAFNGGTLIQLDDNSTYNNTFNLSVWFGASKNSSGQPFRHFKGTLSNIYIRLGTYSLQ